MYLIAVLQPVYSISVSDQMMQPRKAIDYKQGFMPYKEARPEGNILNHYLILLILTEVTQKFLNFSWTPKILDIKKGL